MNKTMYRGTLALGAVALAALLSACGGGGADAGTSPFNKTTTTETAVSVNELRMTLNTSTLSNTSTAPVTVTVKALASNSQVIPGVTVAYEVKGGGDLTVLSSTTDTKGENSASVDLGGNLSNRTVSVTATAGGKTVTKYFSVVGSKIEPILANSLVDASSTGTVTFTVKDANGNAQAAIPIVVANSSGATAQGTTASDGSYVYTYTAPSSAGSTFTLTASAAGVQKQQTLTVKSASQTLPDAVLTTVTPSLQANPNVIAVNADGGSTNKVALLANFEDSSGNPIPNVRVKFKLSDASIVYGGSFSTGAISGTSLTNSGNDGRVQVNYIPGSRSSANDAVEIIACYGRNDADANACLTNQQLRKTITIADEPVSITIGTDGLLINESSLGRYAQNFVMQVVNSAGQPKANVEVSAQVATVRYYKGYYTRVASRWEVSGSATCAKEDLDDDDRLDTLPIAEDVNHNGQLEPRRADVILVPVNGTKTNSEGVVIYKLAYPKDKGSWLDVQIMATSVVGGSEGRASRSQRLAVLASDITAEADPAFKLSPYGTVFANVTLTQDRVMPDGTTIANGTTLTPCQNPD